MSTNCSSCASVHVKMDSAKQRYINVGGVRVTLVEPGHTGGRCVRVQAYTGNGDALHKGAEIPVDALPKIVQACTVLETLDRLIRDDQLQGTAEFDLDLG